MEFDELRKELLRRFDRDFTPDHQSISKSLARDATYWWSIARTWDAAQADGQYKQEIKERLHKNVVSPEELAGKLEASLVAVSENFLSARFRVGDNSSMQKTINSNQSRASLSLDTFPKIGAAALTSNSARTATYETVKRLTKYYVSQKDALILTGKIGKNTRAACGLNANLCKAAISEGYRLTREGMKRAGIRIGATAGKAAGIANVVGIAVLSVEAYATYQDYASTLKGRTEELKVDLNGGLETLIASYCGPDGEFRRQIRLVSEKVIEQRTSAWPFNI